jgi:hypothetical protein
MCWQIFYRLCLGWRHERGEGEVREEAGKGRGLTMVYSKTTNGRDNKTTSQKMSTMTHTNCQHRGGDAHTLTHTQTTHTHVANIIQRTLEGASSSWRVEKFLLS